MCALIALAGFFLPFGWLGEESFSLCQDYLRNGNAWFSWVLIAYLTAAAAYSPLLGCPIGAAALELIPIYCCWRVMGSYASALGQTWALSRLAAGAWIHVAGLLGVCASPFLRRLLPVWNVKEDVV